MDINQVQLESKPVFGSNELFLNGKRLQKFPVQRPVDKAILVFKPDGTFLGNGIGSDCPKTGGCIKIDGQKYDSNHDLLWQYAQPE